MGPKRESCSMSLTSGLHSEEDNALFLMGQKSFIPFAGFASNAIVFEDMYQSLMRYSMQCFWEVKEDFADFCTAIHSKCQVVHHFR